MRLFWLILLLLFIVPNAYAAGVPESGAIDILLETFGNAAAKWAPILRETAIRIFWILVTISWTWTFIWMMFKDSNYPEIIAELTRRVVLIGIFSWFLFDGVWIASSIVEGFQYLALKLGGTPIKPSSIFDIGYSLASSIIKKLTYTDWADNIGFILAGLGILIIFAYITLEMMLVTIQYYIMLNLGVILMGFLGHEWSREYGINYFRLMLSIGVKFLCMQMIIVLSMEILNSWLKTSDLTWTQILLILPCIIVIWGLVREVPAMAQSLVSGSDTTSGNAMAGAMQAAATTAALTAGAIALASGGGGLLKNAWSQAGGDGGDSGGDGGGGNDPATSPLAENNDGGGGGEANASPLPRSHGNDNADFQGSISGSEQSPSNANPQDNGSEQAAPKSSLASKFVTTAKIASGALAKEGASSAKKAFLSSQDTFIGRAANSLAPNKKD